MLFGCIHVPEFAVQVVVRRRPALLFQKDPIAVLDGPESLMKVFICNNAARRRGITPGMTKVQAEASPGLVLCRREEALEESAQAELLDCGYSFSPIVESTAPGTIIMDLTGTKRFLGEEAEIARELSRRAEEFSFVVNVALAATADAALHAARGFARITVIAAGEEASRLGSLPVEVLQPGPEILGTLENWGIRNFRALATLPSIPLIQRLGQRGLHLQRLARGEVQRALIPAESTAVFREELELEEPVELLEPLMSAISRLLEKLMTRLVGRSLATDHIQLSLELEFHPDRELKAGNTPATVTQSYQRTLKVPVPTQNAKIAVKLLQLDLDAHPPEAAVKRIAIEAYPAYVRFGQGGLFQPLAPEPAKLEITAARLRAIVGEQDEEGCACVGFPSVRESHKADSFQVRGFCPKSKPFKESKDPSSAPGLLLRRFRPPKLARVEIAGGVPGMVVFHGARSSVIHASGPWRSSGSWWDEKEWQREEWDLELSINGSAGIYRVFRETKSGQWFVEGIYD